jgi:hypothetical protein
MKRLFVVLVAVLSLACITRLVFSQVPSHPPEPGDSYPRLAGYAPNRSYGAPYVKADGSLDSLLLRRYARHNMVTLDVAPFWPTRPDIPMLLRDYNHSLKVLGYIQGGEPWLATAPATAFPALYWNTLVSYDGFMYVLGTNTIHAMRVNWGNATLADTLAKLFARVGASGVFDGLFLDSIGIECAWMGLGANPPFDLARAGFATGAQMDSARRVNVERLTTYVKSVCGSQFVVVLNGWQSTNGDGVMREGFDHGLVTFDQAIQWDTTTTASGRNILKSEDAWSGPYVSSALRGVRYALGTACLGHSYMSESLRSDGYLEQEWTYDEFSVEPKFHHSDTTGRFIGWLGPAVAPPVRFTSGLWRRDFPNGFVLVNPTGVTLAHDFGQLVWQIQGIRDPVVNGGQKVRSVSVPPHDARFYMRVPRPPGRPGASQ